MTNVNLGETPKDQGYRDAVHVAVIAVKAAKTLKPGLRVSIDKDGIASDGGEEVGIVDPFLRKPVLKHELFWLYLFPGTVSGMQHHWVHPSFLEKKDASPSKTKSEEWLRSYAIRMNLYDEPEEAFSRLIRGLLAGKLHARGSDLHGRHELYDAYELQGHAEAYLGIRINWDEFEFSCSC